MTGSCIQVFEWSPATASTPVDAPESLAREGFTRALRRLEAKGVRVERHAVQEDRSALNASFTVKSAFEAQGPDCLPIVIVNQTIISVGGYPTPVELAEAAAETDTELLGELATEAAALGAALAANAFERFQRHYQRLQALGIRGEELARVVQAGATAAAGLLQDDVRTRVEQLLAFGPRGKPPKPRCACGDEA